jgi:hypothetical protein
MRRSEEESPDERTALSLARRIGCKAEDLVEALGLVDASEDPIREIQEGFASIYLGNLPEEVTVPLARVIGTPSGPHRELFWVINQVEERVARRINPRDVASRRLLLPPRIFAEARTFDRDGERDAKDLIRLLDMVLVAETDDHRRARYATRIALEAMRPSERYLLLGRLRGKRGAPKTTWYALANGLACDFNTGSVQLTKEVFKVALDEFLQLYARVTNDLRAERDF